METEPHDNLNVTNTPLTGQFEIISPIAPDGSYRLLTAEEEIMLAQSIQLGHIARQALTEQDQLSSEDERALLEMAVVESERASRTMFVHNMGMIYSIVNRYELDRQDDLFQAGSIALLEAAKRFLPEKGNRFSTYAYISIQREVQVANREFTMSVRIPDGFASIHHRLHSYMRKFEQDNGYLPGVADVANYFKVRPTIAKKYILQYNSVRPARSLNDSYTDDATSPELLEFVEDRTIGIDEFIISRERLRVMREIANARNLTDLERHVILAHYGLYDTEPLSLESISNELQVSKERIKQLNQAALKKLKLRAKGFRIESVDDI